MIAAGTATDIVMLGTFSAWKAGTIQARALPFALALKQAGYRVAIVTTPWDEPESAGQIDVTSGIPIINTAATSPSSSLAAVQQQLSWVSRLSPRAVHVIKPRGFGGLAAARLLHKRARPKVVVDSDDWEGDGGWNDAGSYSLPMRRVFNWQERHLLTEADHVITASQLLTARARRLHGNDSSVTLIPNGIQRAWLAALSSAGANACREPRRALLYSRFKEFPSNWFGEFVAGLGAVSREPVEVMLVGDSGAIGDSLPTMNRVRVIDCGWVERASLPKILASGQLAVFPLEDSLIARSKQSVKLLELMAVGCPVIASNVGEVPAILGDSATLVDGLNPSAFAQRVAELLDDPGQIDSLRERARLRASSFSAECVSAGLPGVYRSLGVWPR